VVTIYFNYKTRKQDSEETEIRGRVSLAFQRPVLTAFRFLFPKTLTDSSHEEITVATFVNK